MTTLSKNKVVLGLSGGVDSTAAALLLAEKGLEVIGFYFDVLGNHTEEYKAAQKLADQLGIPLITEDVSKEFNEQIIGNFCREYSCGRTPNPCVICNPQIKFRKLLETADREGAYYIATGHYARVKHDAETGVFYIRRGASEKKDQSYMLYRLGQNVLSRLMLPLGETAEKEETRELLRKQGLSNAEVSDSQEICFIDEKTDDYVSFLIRRGFSCQKGDFVSRDGAVLGEHQGIIRYTVGQRKGLGISLGKPAFVTGIDAENNRVVLGDNADLFQTEVFAEDLFFTASDGRCIPECLKNNPALCAKIRYAAPLSPAALEETEHGLKAVFEKPQRAPAAGQSIVFYCGDTVVGGGFIK